MTALALLFLMVVTVLNLTAQKTHCVWHWYSANWANPHLTPLSCQASCCILHIHTYNNLCYSNQSPRYDVHL